MTPDDRHRFTRHAAARPEFWAWVLVRWSEGHDGRPVHEVLGCSPEACEALGLWLRPHEDGRREADIAKTAAATGIDPARLAAVLAEVELRP